MKLVEFNMQVALEDEEDEEKLANEIYHLLIRYVDIQEFEILHTEENWEG